MIRPAIARDEGVFRTGTMRFMLKIVLIMLKKEHQIRD